MKEKIEPTPEEVIESVAASVYTLIKSLGLDNFEYEALVKGDKVLRLSLEDK